MLGLYDPRPIDELGLGSYLQRLVKRSLYLVSICALVGWIAWKGPWRDEVPRAPSEVEPAETPTPEAPPKASADLSGDFAIPVAGVAVSDLVDSYHDPRSGGRTHLALDIMAPRDTPVLAVADGTVERLFLSEKGGLTIYQFGPREKFCFYYAHLERYADGLQEGDLVRRGEVIGYVGTSGNAAENAPHLHFSISRLGPEKRWWKGEPINPFPVLQAGVLP